MLGNLRVNAQSSQERACILDARGLASDEHAETCNANERNTDVAKASLLGSVGNIANNDGHNGGSGVRWYGEQVGGSTTVSKCTDDGRQEE